MDGTVLLDCDDTNIFVVFSLPVYGSGELVASRLDDFSNDIDEPLDVAVEFFDCPSTGQHKEYTIAYKMSLLNCAPLFH